MRKIILNLAMSLDGYICDEEGGYDWIVGQGNQEKDTQNVFDFEAFMKTIDTVVMGSKSYEDCILSGLTDLGDRRIIVATSRTFPEKPHTQFINGDICSEVMTLKEEKGKDIWLFGGAGLIEPFVKENIIDRYIIAIIPTILGQGRRLFRGGAPQIKLLLDNYALSDGIMVMEYKKR